MNFLTKLTFVLIFSLWLSSCNNEKDKPKEPAADTTAKTEATQKKPDGPIIILNWGPNFTKAGQDFNVQDNGESALWFNVQNGTRNTVVYWDTQQLLSNSDTLATIITASVPKNLYRKPGDVRLHLRDTLTGNTSMNVVFIIN